MTKRPLHILNQEQVEAHREAAREANPNKAKIDELREQMSSLSQEISKLVSDDEKYYNILMFLSKDYDSRKAAVSLMSNQEIGEHMSHLFFEHTKGEIDETILMEALERLGWKPDDEDGE